MIGALLWREIAAGTRTRAFAAALGVHAGLLAAFVTLWSGGVPLLPGENLYEQQRLVDAAILVVLLPWVASRCGADERGDHLVMISAVAATPPSRILVGRFVAHACASLAVGLAGLPVMVAAQQMSAVPIGRVALDLFPLVALALLASAAALWWSLQSRGVILAWVCATLSTVLVTVAATRSMSERVAPLVVALLAAVVVASSVTRADTTLRYLSEQNR